ncbi:MAG: trypco2 family protein [Cyanobacteriota bacterium]
MAEENTIGLAELIEQVKRELLTPSSEDKAHIPLLSVDEVELELQVTVKKDVKGGIKIYVLELGGGGSRDDVQKVKVKLSPIVSKETLLGLYKKRHPERLSELVDTSFEGIYKGGSGENLNEQF